MRHTAARTLAIAGALLGWAALLLQLVLLIDSFQAQGGTVLGGVWRFVGYFTILTNILAAVVLTHAGARPGTTSGLGDSRIELSVATAMALVGIVYSVLLRALWDPQGWQKVADVTLHDVIPVIVVLFFLLRGHGALHWRDSAFALIFPLSYCAYALVRGAADGWYAYPFLDPSKLSAAQMAANMAGLMLGVWMVAVALIALAKLVGRKREA
ncbi:MAG: hypothetical protein GEU95_23860 [Rhizobiales bacterium]|nr:hypothetical protein [Hyphomicrobiales bacterium]